MKPEERAAYARYRIHAARKAYEAALLLAENGYWDSCINRLYYALFYAVNGLLVVNGITTKSHAAAKSQFSLHFVKTGKFEKKYGRLFSELFDWRQRGDYDNIYDYDQEVVEPLLEPTKSLIDLIESEINKVI